MKDLTGEVTIGLVGKYVSLPDAYFSVAEALRHVDYMLEEESFAQAEGVLDRISAAWELLIHGYRVR